MPCLANKNESVASRQIQWQVMRWCNFSLCIERESIFTKYVTNLILSHLTKTPTTLTLQRLPGVWFYGSQVDSSHFLVTCPIYLNRSISSRVAPGTARNEQYISTELMDHRSDKSLNWWKYWNIQLILQIAALHSDTPGRWLVRGCFFRWSCPPPN
jgi:hypothetical protein